MKKNKIKKSINNKNNTNEAAESADNTDDGAPSLK